MKSEFKSAYSCLGGYSYLVSWKRKKELCRIETRSRGEALTMCSKLKSRVQATCHMIDCLTSRKIKKIA